MKAKALQFGKAMSAALFVLLLSVVGLKNALAQNQVATLQHGDSVCAFYGPGALGEAHEAADHGDIITLSGGWFSANGITKAITLRGAGFVTDSVTGTPPTSISGDIWLNVTGTDGFLTIEGVLFSGTVYYIYLNNPKFNRCCFHGISYVSSTIQMLSPLFINCIIENFSFYYTNYTQLINSMVLKANGIHSNHEVLAHHSIIGFNGNSPDALTAHNSIIFGGTSLSTCSFFNCIGINWSFGYAYTTGCVNYDSYEDVFETFNGSFSLDESFILKDEIATGFVSSDGTQVGIYGGMVPYSTRPNYMVVKRCNVAPQSTIDGKLSVEIEVVTEGN